MVTELVAVGRGGVPLSSHFSRERLCSRGLTYRRSLFRVQYRPLLLSSTRASKYSTKTMERTLCRRWHRRRNNLHSEPVSARRSLSSRSTASSQVGNGPPATDSYF